MAKKKKSRNYKNNNIKKKNRNLDLYWSYRYGPYDQMTSVAEEHFSESLTWAYGKLVDEFMISTKDFTSIIQNRHKKITRKIPDDLKRFLSDYVGDRISYYPKRSIFDLIPKELREEVYGKYFKIKPILPYEGYIWQIILDYFNALLLNEIKEKEYDLIKIMDKLMIRVPKDIREIILKEYSKNWQERLKFKLKEAEVPKDVIPNYDKAKEIIIRNLKIPNRYFSEEFYALTPIEKKILFDILFELNENMIYHLRSERISVSDKNMLLDIAVDEYIDLYEKYNSDFLQYFISEKKKEKNMFSATLFCSFNKLIDEYKMSTKTYTSIVQNRHNQIVGNIPDDLKRILIDYAESNYIAYYPNRSVFNLIPKELRMEIYGKYFFDNDIIDWPLDLKPFWKIVLNNCIMPFLNGLNVKKYELIKTLENVIAKVPNDIKQYIIKEYGKNWTDRLKFKINVQKEEEEMFNSLESEAEILLDLKYYPILENLNPIEKKIIFDIGYSLIYENLYEKQSNEKLDPLDKNMVLDIVVDEYINLYKTHDVDFLRYFSRK